MFKICNSMKPLKIIDKLFLGDHHTSKDLKLLKLNQIIAIANIGGGDNQYPSEFKYNKITMTDSDKSDIGLYLDNVLAFIHNQRQIGNVLIHCRGGICRSPSFIIAYLAKYEKMAIDEAIQLLKSKRKSIRPREVFINDIKSWLLKSA